MFGTLNAYGTCTWITDSEHFIEFLNLAYSADFYGEIWLYNNDLNVITDPKTFRNLYLNGIFGKHLGKVDAVKILVDEEHQEQVFGKDGSIQHKELKNRMLELFSTKDGQQKIDTFFFGKVSKAKVQSIAPNYTLIFYLHQNRLTLNEQSGVVMVRPHVYPFFKGEGGLQYAVVWQLIDNPDPISERLKVFNNIFNNSKLFHRVVIENNEPKLSANSGWSASYEQKRSNRVSQECDGLLIGEKVDYVILASNSEELRHLTDELNANHQTPIRQDFNFAIMRKGSKKLKIVMGCTREGNIRAAVETWEAIKIWKPKDVIFIGVAGGDPADKNLEVGDIIIAEEIVGYEYASVKDDASGMWKYTSAKKPHQVSSLLKEAERLANGDKWSQLACTECTMLGRKSETIRVISQPIASGNKRVESKAYFKMLQNCVDNKIKAVEMEGDGVAQACEFADRKVLIIRGIMDKCTKKTRRNREHRRNVRSAVSKYVAQFVRDLLLSKLE